MCIMESDPHMHLDLYGRMPVLIDGTSPQLLSESHLRTSFFHPSNQNDRIIGLPEGQSFRDPQSDKNVNFDELLDRNNFNHRHLCSGDTSFGSNSLETLLTGRNGPNCDLNNILVPLQEDLASESLREIYSSNRFVMQPELNWRISTSDMEPVQFSEVQGANEWGLTRSTNLCSSQDYEPLRLQNELCLSLATTGPSFPNPESVQEQCSDMGYSSIFDSSQRSQCNKEVLLSRASSSQSTQVSQLISGSRYRAVLKQILLEVSSFSLDNVDQANFSVGSLVSSSSNVLFSSDQFGTNEFLDNDGSVEAPSGSSRRKQKLESKKSQLLSLLQVVDDQYTRCLDQIHTVISAFHAASDLDPQLHACFALQSVSFFYKSLRQRISNQILEMGMDGEVSGDSRTSFEKSFIQKQWALQQLKKKDQQLWRPQRGLPEKSVSVLRSWMFDNFLHPYPKDSEKHLLAIKSGLSRSQVSNWFINARVRLWKPMVEEMCSELNRRKGSRQNEGSNDNNSKSSQLTIYDINQRFNP